MSGFWSSVRPWRFHGKSKGASLVIAVGLAASPAFAGDKHAALLLDVNSGQILHQNAADAPRYPASLTKLMTLYLVFERLEQGKLEPQTKLKVSAHASAAAPSKLDLDEGDEITVSDAIKALITKSANDVAITLAEHIAGSEERFARLMTEKAHQIGMAATTFRNASGLPDDQQVTTARDMATLALRLIDDFPKYYPLFATRTFTYKGETLRNHNSLLFHYKGTEGLKTGYTRASGFNLVASVRRGRKHVIGVVFGGPTAAARNTTMRALLNTGLAKSASVETRRRTLVAAAADRKGAAVPAQPGPHLPSLKVSAPPAAAASLPGAPGSARIEVLPVKPNPLRPGRQDPPPAGETAAAPATMEALIEASLWANPGAPQPAARLGREPEAAAAATPRGRLETPSLLAQPRLVRGSPPSTLERQAASLAGDEISAPRSSAAPGGGMAIQVGAFQSAGEAQRRLAWVREHASAVVGAREAVTQPIKQGEKLFYRARFAGFDNAAAASACKELRALKVDCLIMRPD